MYPQGYWKEVVVKRAAPAHRLQTTDLFRWTMFDLSQIFVMFVKGYHTQSGFHSLRSVFPSKQILNFNINV